MKLSESCNYKSEIMKWIALLIKTVLLKKYNIYRLDQFSERQNAISIK